MRTLKLLRATYSKELREFRKRSTIIIKQGKILKIKYLFNNIKKKYHEKKNYINVHGTYDYYSQGDNPYVPLFYFSGFI